MFNDLSTKINWLRQNSSTPIIKAFDLKIRNELSSQFSEATLAKGVINQISLDVSYALFKNIKWVQLPIFQQILTNFLVSNYNLDPDKCASLLDQCNLTLSKLLGKSSPEPIESVSEKAFLKYLYVASSTAKRDSDLVTVFGLGPQIISQIHSAVNLAIQSKGKSLDSSKLKFLPEMDANFLDIILELAKEVQETPFAIDLARLSFALIDLDEKQKLITSEIEPLVILELITFIGMHRSPTRQFIESQFQGLGNITALLNLLEQRKLIYCAVQAKKDSLSKWGLTEDGYDISSIAFASKNPSDSLGLKDFRQLPTFYQLAIVEHINDKNQIPALLERVEEFAIAPNTLAIAFEKIAKYGDVQLVPPLIWQLIEKAPSPWLRKAACRSAKRYLSVDENRQLIQKLAELDPSQTVQEFALEQMILGIVNNGATRATV